MKFVGEQLEKLALLEPVKKQADTLGRSAFNRYYYASFLITREMLGSLDPKWKHTAHAAIPNHLRTAIRRLVKSQLDKAVKQELVTISQKSRLLTALKIATDELANLLTEAYAVRIVADYQPEIPIIVEEKVIILDGNKLTLASKWPSRANMYCSKILKVWRDTGFV